jgi:hypothetical protein
MCTLVEREVWYFSSIQLTPLAKGFLDQSCEVTEGVMKNQVLFFPMPCKVARCK